MISYTINTDASFSNEFKRAAYAYWIKGDDGFHVKKAGMFRQRIDNSTTAELLAFEKAVQVINQRFPLKYRGAVLLFVNTDCKWVIKVIEGEPVGRRHWALVTAVRHIIKGYKIDARHVKAHTDDLSESRAWVNDWCDRAAKKEMGKELYS